MDKNMKTILFNTEMVKAIMDGRKTVTRRLIKPQPEANANMAYTYAAGRKKDWGKWRDLQTGQQWTPPYHAGDILYVRETWCRGKVDYGEEPDGRCVPFISQCPGEDDIIHKEWAIREDIGIEDVVWRPSIHMPKEAARIILRVKSVRVERLQSITEDQALAEGVPDDWPMDPVYCPVCKGEGLIGAVHPATLGYMEVDCPHCEKAVSRFANLWDSTIKPDDWTTCSWDANPWVWVIKFERFEKPKEE